MNPSARYAREFYDSLKQMKYGDAEFDIGYGIRILISTMFCSEEVE